MKEPDLPLTRGLDKATAFAEMREFKCKYPYIVFYLRKGMIKGNYIVMRWMEPNEGAMSSTTN
mgnify:CR=1 FL=1